MRLLLVDDHVLFLEGLRNLLAASGMEVAGTASNGKDALAQVEILQPDVVLMDIQMPEPDGIATTRLIKARHPAVKIVMLTIAQDDQYLFEAIKAGASGYLLKGLEKERFLELLTGMANGESPLSPGLAAKIMAEFARRENERAAEENAATELSKQLTPRQSEILRLVAQGMTYKEIGDKLNISEAAVKYHMGEITSRLHLENRAQVVAYAAELGLKPRNGRD
jgi:Response regulator containing a CheY-like receiver domain and an HTH DNA-binding domain